MGTIQSQRTTHQRSPTPDSRGGLQETTFVPRLLNAIPLFGEVAIGREFAIHPQARPCCPMMSQLFPLPRTQAEADPVSLAVQTRHLVGAPLRK